MLRQVLEAAALLVVEASAMLILVVKENVISKCEMSLDNVLTL